MRSPRLDGIEELHEATVHSRPDLNVTHATEVLRPIKLPPVAFPPSAPSLSRLRCASNFVEGSLTLDEIAVALAAAYGVTDQAGGDEVALRPVPSAGAAYPLRIYVLVQSVAGVRRGAYRFLPRERLLQPSAGLGPGAHLFEIFFSQEIVRTAPAIFIITLRTGRVPARYGSRGYRYALLEAGHVAQNMLMALQGLGARSTPLGGFYDSALAHLLGVARSKELPLYGLASGAA